MRSPLFDLQEAKENLKGTGETFDLRNDDQTRKGHAEEYSKLVQYEQCNWISRLLEENRAIGKPLPKPGTNRPGGTFWLKRPLLHTKFPFMSIPTFQNLPFDSKQFFEMQLQPSAETEQDEIEVMILKYNIYNKDPSWTQHTDKFRNTISVLEKYNFDKEALFPKLYGHCQDLDGFHTVVVEFISQEMVDLELPGTLEKCIERSDAVLEMFEVLDEKYHRALVDFKKGQWMARDGARNMFVLQDIDDIVQSGSPNSYGDQVESFKNSLARTWKLPYTDIDKAWQLNLFPNNKYSIRYDVLGLDLLLNDIGFKWQGKDCAGITEPFKICLNEIYLWGKSLEDDWPTFKQVRKALGLCYEHRHDSLYRTKFDEVIREENPKAPGYWRDRDRILTETERSELVFKPTNRCKRNHDSMSSEKHSWKVRWCDHSCCRNKASESCYYAVDEAMCN